MDIYLVTRLSITMFCIAFDYLSVALRLNKDNGLSVFHFFRLWPTERQPDCVDFSLCGEGCRSEHGQRRLSRLTPRITVQCALRQTTSTAKTTTTYFTHPRSAEAQLSSGEQLQVIRCLLASMDSCQTMSSAIDAKHGASATLFHLMFNVKCLTHIFCSRYPGVRILQIIGDDGWQTLIRNAVTSPRLNYIITRSKILTLQEGTGSGMIIGIR